MPDGGKGKDHNEVNFGMTELACPWKFERRRGSNSEGVGKVAEPH